MSGDVTLALDDAGPLGLQVEVEVGTNARWGSDR
jgi:hypothetical protein